MLKDKNRLSILAIEDNPGDYFLIEEFLNEKIVSPDVLNATSYNEAKTQLESDRKFDVILLDLTLTDHSGESLITDIKKVASNIPIIVLTGYIDIAFAAKSIALGISDYLLKDELSAATLYKSIVYSIERNKFISDINESKQRYSDLFHLSPIPIWVFDIDTLEFLDVNDAAIRHYGYSYDEFMTMTLKDIRPVEEIPKLMDRITVRKAGETRHSHGIFKHLKKNGELIHVSVEGNVISYKGKRAEVILAHDITETIRQNEESKKQNEKLKEIAWMQSHVVRAPLANIMGLIPIINDDTTSIDDKTLSLELILKSAHKLDEIIHEIVEKSQYIDFDKPSDTP